MTFAHVSLNSLKPLVTWTLFSF